MSSGPSASDIKSLLRSQAPRLAAELHPEGYRSGGYWMCRSSQSEIVGGKWIRISGEKAGGWRDEAGDRQGDPFGLIAEAHGWDTRTEFPRVLQWARGFLGLEAASAADTQDRLAAARRVEQQASAGAADKIAQERKRALGLFVRARAAPFLGSPADLYLQGRGIDVRRLGRMPGCLGWLAPFERRDGTVSPPAMLAGITSADGQIVAVHRTFLANERHGGRPDAGRERLWLGWGKVPGEPRKIWPAGWAGGAIRLWRGGSGLDVKAAAKAGLRERLVLVEGFEDGLSVALAKPDLRVWCAATLGNLAALAMPECCDQVTLCADNDWGKPQASAALEKAVLALARQDVEVSIARSPVGKDFNDALRAGDRAGAE